MFSITEFLLATLLILISFFTGYILLGLRRPSNYPPGPRWLPILGNSPLLKRMSILHQGFHKALVQLSKDYKSNILGLKLGSDLYVVVFSKDLIKQVFTEEEFQARPDSYFIRLRTMGSRKGITMTDGDFWQEQRNFAVRHLRNLGFGKSHMESLIIEELQEFMVTVNSCGNDVSLHNTLAPCVLNVLWALTAGSRFPPSDPQLRRLLDLMSARARAFDMAGGVLSQLPILARLAPEWSGYNIICSLNNELNSLLQKIIEEHKQTLKMENTRDFIDAYIKEIIQSNGHPTSFTEEQLVMVCLDFFIAGSQTTSNTLSFALLNMVIHQDVQDQAFEEIKNVLGDRKIPSLEDRCRLPFVEAVLTESQRYLHVVPVAGPRRVLKDTILDGYNIPKNTTILLSLYSAHHDDKLWDQPMRFWPERFLQKKNQKLAEELYQFGLGRRRCLGEALAKNFLFLFFTGILRNYRLGVPKGKEPPSLDPIPGITLSPKPYSVCFRPREE